MNIGIALCELEHKGDRLLADWLPPITKELGIQLLVPSTAQIDVAERVMNDPANASISLWGPFVMHHRGQEPALLLERTKVRLTPDTFHDFTVQDQANHSNRPMLIGNYKMVPVAIKLPEGTEYDSRAMKPHAWLSNADGDQLPLDVAKRFGIEDSFHEQDFLVGKITVTT